MNTPRNCYNRSVKSRVPLPSIVFPLLLRLETFVGFPTNILGKLINLKGFRYFKQLGSFYTLQWLHGYPYIFSRRSRLWYYFFGALNKGLYFSKISFRSNQNDRYIPLDDIIFETYFHRSPIIIIHYDDNDVDVDDNDSTVGCWRRQSCSFHYHIY